jgi:LPXTG-motif cell wall-anchored protein
MIVRALTVTAGAAAAILLPATASLADGGATDTSYGNNGGGLPVTGFPFATVAAVGVVLLLVGAVLVVAYRRREQPQ